MVTAELPNRATWFLRKASILTPGGNWTALEGLAIWGPARWEVTWEGTVGGSATGGVEARWGCRLGVVRDNAAGMEGVVTAAVHTVADRVVTCVGVAAGVVSFEIGCDTAAVEGVITGVSVDKEGEEPEGCVVMGMSIDERDETLGVCTEVRRAGVVRGVARGVSKETDWEVVAEQEVAGGMGSGVEEGGVSLIGAE